MLTSISFSCRPSKTISGLLFVTELLIFSCFFSLLSSVDDESYNTTNNEKWTNNNQNNGPNWKWVWVFINMSFSSNINQRKIVVVTECVFNSRDVIKFEILGYWSIITVINIDFEFWILFWSWNSGSDNFDIISTNG